MSNAAAHPEKDDGLGSSRMIQLLIGHCRCGLTDSYCRQQSARDGDRANSQRIASRHISNDWSVNRFHCRTCSADSLFDLK
jgi:hypothetical protein